MTADTQDLKPTPINEWKKSAATPVELPSGKFMRIRRMSMTALMATGKLPNSLLSIVQSAVAKGVGMDGMEDQMQDIISDTDKLREMAKFMSDLVVMVSVEPKVHPEPQNETDRRDDLLYADEIDEQDKSYLFALVTGGTGNLEQFREAANANVVALSGREDMELSPVGVAETH